MINDGQNMILKQIKYPESKINDNHFHVRDLVPLFEQKKKSSVQNVDLTIMGDLKNKKLTENENYEGMEDHESVLIEHTLDMKDDSPISTASCICYCKRRYDLCICNHECVCGQKDCKGDCWSEIEYSVVEIVETTTPTQIVDCNNKFDHDNYGHSPSADLDSYNYDDENTSRNIEKGKKKSVGPNVETAEYSQLKENEFITNTDLYSNNLYENNKLSNNNYYEIMNGNDTNSLIEANPLEKTAIDSYVSANDNSFKLIDKHLIDDGFKQSLINMNNRKFHESNRKVTSSKIFDEENVKYEVMIDSASQLEQIRLSQARNSLFINDFNSNLPQSEHNTFSNNAQGSSNNQEMPFSARLMINHPSAHSENVPRSHSSAQNNKNENLIKSSAKEYNSEEETRNTPVIAYLSLNHRRNELADDFISEDINDASNNEFHDDEINSDQNTYLSKKNYEESKFRNRHSANDNSGDQKCNKKFEINISDNSPIVDAKNIKASFENEVDLENYYYAGSTNNMSRGNFNGLNVVPVNEYGNTVSNTSQQTKFQKVYLDSAQDYKNNDFFYSDLNANHLPNEKIAYSNQYNSMYDVYNNDYSYFNDNNNRANRSYNLNFNRTQFDPSRAYKNNCDDNFNTNQAYDVIGSFNAQDYKKVDSEGLINQINHSSTRKIEVDMDPHQKFDVVESEDKNKNNKQQEISCCHCHRIERCKKNTLHSDSKNHQQSRSFLDSNKNFFSSCNHSGQNESVNDADKNDSVTCNHRCYILPCDNKISSRTTRNRSKNHYHTHKVKIDNF